MKNGSAAFAWHVHHTELIEPLTKPLEVRQEYIRKNKPIAEHELRLRLLKPVQGPISRVYYKAGKAYVKAWIAYEEAGKACAKAWIAYEEAGKAYDKEWTAFDKAWTVYDEARRVYDEAGKVCHDDIIALHQLECPDCPWDGHSIFPV